MCLERSGRDAGFVVSDEMRAGALVALAGERTRRWLRGAVQAAIGPAGASSRPSFAHKASYYKYCKGALMRALAPHWRGTHAALKARVRAILHPRRHDLSFLGGILRATVVPAALSVFMLAASATPAHAVKFCALAYDELIGSPNPLNGLVPGFHSAPDVADLDGDGDYDLVSGTLAGTLRYYLNTGTAQLPAFVEQLEAANPLSGVLVGANSVPAFADVDGDLDVDVVVGDTTGSLRYFENDGTVFIPVFTEQLGTDNPFDGIDVGAESAPALADLDGDSDLDLYIGELEAGILYFKNTGTSTSPIFTPQVEANNPFFGFVFRESAAVTFGDLENDGDLDALVGGADGLFQCLRNGGSATIPKFVEMPATSNPLNGLQAFNQLSKPSLADLDSDGDLDCVSGGLYGFLQTFASNGSDSPLYFEKTGAENPLAGVNVIYVSRPSFADLDDDGDLDGLIGNREGGTVYLLNTGTDVAPEFVTQPEGLNPFNGILFDYIVPAFADLDADGDSDALFGKKSVGSLKYYKNEGTPTSPEFSDQTGANNPMDTFNFTNFTAPAFADLDGDNDLDLLVGDLEGNLRYFENTGTPQAPIFTERTGASNPLDGKSPGLTTIPTFADTDLDGDQDLVIGQFTGQINYYLNTGTPLAPVYVKQTGVGAPFLGVNVGNDCSPTFADINGDGGPDLVVGKVDGRLRYFERAGGCGAQPVAVCKDITVALAPDGEATITGEDIDDGSTASLGIASIFASPSQFGCDDIGPNVVTLTIDDGEADPVTCTATVTIVDAAPPLIEAAAPGIAECGDSYVDVPPAALDACDESVSVATEGAVDTSTPGEYELTYTAIDAAGNEAVPVVRTVTVEDTTPPVIAAAEPVTVNCGQNFVDTSPAAADVCDGPVPVITTGEVDESAPGEYLLTYNASDGAGNDATPVTRIVTVEDLSPPVIASGGAVTISCGDAYVDVPPVATDACEGTVAVITTGTVLSSIPGGYALFYDASDNSGNVANATFRSITVLDNCAAEGEGEGAAEGEGEGAAEGEGEGAAEGEGEGEGEGAETGIQTADQDGNNVISLSELLRVIQFYNIGGLHCADPPTSTEDGYVPGPGADQSCAPYDTDYQPQNWIISLSELLRVIQFYNIGGYRYCPDENTEDDFCPGLV